MSWPTGYVWTSVNYIDAPWDHTCGVQCYKDPKKSCRRKVWEFQVKAWEKFDAHLWGPAPKDQVPIDLVTDIWTLCSKSIREEKRCRNYFALKGWFEPRRTLYEELLLYKIMQQYQVPEGAWSMILAYLAPEGCRG